MLPKKILNARSGPKIILSFLLMLQSGCVAANHSKLTATRYSKMSTEGNLWGHKIYDMGDGLLMNKFTGNGFTEKKTASLFSRFRAIEYCRQKGFKTIHLLNTEDNSLTRDSYSTTTVYNKTYLNNDPTVYPIFTTGFSCKNTVRFMYFKFVMRTDPFFLNLANTTKPVAWVTKITGDKSKLQVGDVIISINEQAFSNYFEANILSESRDNSVMKVKLIRDKRELVVFELLNDATTHYQNLVTSFLNKNCKQTELRSRPVCSTEVN